MAITLPMPVRVAAGVLATGIDRLRSLPEDLPTIPVTLAGQAMRLSMRVQQEIAELATRGDQLLSTVMGGPEESPEWARFDDEEPAPVTRLPRREAQDAPGSETPDDEARAAANRDAESLLERADAELTPGKRPARAARARTTTKGPAPSRRRPTAKARSTSSPGPRKPPTDAGPADPGASTVAPTAAVDREPRGSAAPADPPWRDPAEQDPPTASFDLADSSGPADPPTASFDQADSSLPAELPDPPSTPAGDGDDVLPGYDSMTLAQVRGHLRDLDVADIGRLLAREQAGGNRAPFLTLLGNRLVTLDHQDS